jgi:sec-independent protein translocase protein TatA
MPRIGFPELILIVLVILIFFGVGKLPQVGEALGKGIRAFRRGQNTDDEKDPTKPMESKQVKEEKKEKES